MSEERREFKTKFEHWEIIVAYLEKYPQLIKAKFEKFDGDGLEVKKLWMQLAEHLNSLGYGKKSPEKWQLAVGRWKSKVKAKAANLRIEMQKTGGGPVKTLFLTELEERLMAILGWKSVTGDSNTELGIKRLASEIEEEIPRTEPQQKCTEISPTEPPQKMSKICLALEPQPSTSNMDTPPPLTFFNNENQLREHKMIRKSPKVTSKKISGPRRSRKMASLHQMNTENQVILKNIEESVKSVANSMEEIKKDFREYINFLKTRESQ